MTTALAWIDGRWGPPEQLALPLNDRGLQLAEGLFETVLLRRGVPVLLDQHQLVLIGDGENHHDPGGADTLDIFPAAELEHLQEASLVQ